MFKYIQFIHFFQRGSVYVDEKQKNKNFDDDMHSEKRVKIF